MVAVDSEGFDLVDLAEGIYYEWHSNGLQKLKNTFRSNLKDGQWKYFVPNGETEKSKIMRMA